MARRVLKGIVVSEGMATGPAFIVGTPDLKVEERKILPAELEFELDRFEGALERVRRDIADLESKVRGSLGSEAEIIATYQAFLSDDVHLMGPTRQLIAKERWQAEAAGARRFREVVAELQRLPEPLPSRVPDLRDIERRLIARLLGIETSSRLDQVPRGVVLCADDLSPTQTATLDPTRVLAIATDRGGPASHTAIVARHLGIPAVVGLGVLLSRVRPRDQLIVDGLTGEVTISPDLSEIQGFMTRARKVQSRARSISLQKKPLRTKDGVPIEILGNIDSGEGARELLDLGVAGVGLFRTEYLYLGNADAPDEEIQTRHYSELLRAMGNRPVYLRTMDFGADKWDHRVGAGNEPNPALGLRAIRLSFEHEAVFKAQLRAMLRAAAHGQARILFPMVTDVGEFRRGKAVVSVVEAELAREGVPFGPTVPTGAMIELPAAALCAEALLTEADFLSLGTNDLTQYTLAVDRTNPLVAPSYRPFHPAVLWLLRHAILAANAAGEHNSGCGEMAGSERFVPLLLGVGLRSLSMAASRVPGVVDRIRRLNLGAAEELVAEILRSGDGDRAKAILDNFDSAKPAKSQTR